MPCNENGLMATTEAKLKPGVNGMSKSKADVEAAEEDGVVYGIEDCAAV